MAPAAACCLTVLALTSSHRTASLPEADNATSYLNVMLDAAHSSNAAHQVFALSKMNVNLEWNVWPHVSLHTGAGVLAMTNR